MILLDYPTLRPLEQQVRRRRPRLTRQTSVSRLDLAYHDHFSQPALPCEMCYAGAIQATPPGVMALTRAGLVVGRLASWRDRVAVLVRTGMHVKAL